MGHLIEQDDHMMSAGGVVPWHGLGTVIPSEAASADEALQYAHLDWTVTKEPVYVEQHLTSIGDATKLVPVPDFWATVRSDTKQPLAAVGNRYVAVQNRDGFAFVDALIGAEGGFHFHTAGSLRNGRTVWMLAKAPYAINLPDSAVDMYVLFTNSHDGSSAVRALVTPVRVVCNNTLRAGLSAAVAAVMIRHTSGWAGRLDEAQRVLGLADGARELIAKRAADMLATKISDADFAAFLKSLVPVPAGTGRAATIATNTQAAIGKIYRGDTPEQAPIVGTAWGVWNSVISFNDHAATTRTTSSTPAENRFARITGLTGTNITDRALALLTA